MILLIPIFMSSALNKFALRLAEDYAESASLSKLEQLSRTLDQRMLEFEGIMRQLASNSEVKKLLYEREPVA